MGGKLKRVSTPADEPGLDVRMNQQAKETVSARMRKLARESGVARAITPWGELWMTAQTHVTKYNWKYRVVLLNEQREEIFVVRESGHPTMVDIAVSMVLRLAEVDLGRAVTVDDVEAGPSTGAVVDQDA